MTTTDTITEEQEDALMARLGQKSKNVKGIIYIRLGVLGAIILIGAIFKDVRGGYFKLPLASWVNKAMDWLLDNFSMVFDSIKIVVAMALNNVEKFLLWLPWWTVILLIVVGAWWVAGQRVAIFSAVSMYVILLLGLWDLSMATLALMAIAVFIANLFGIPLGILAASSDRFEGAIRPILDGMQTMPAFVYLIPALMFFGIGRVPGVMACVIYALPPAVRLTNLGIRQVPADLVEAAHAFGTTRSQLLFKVQLPLAMPSIMAGVNQTIMMALGMVTLAAMIAAGGLGREVLLSLGQIDIGRGVAAGGAIIILAMVLDRITQAIGAKG
jgi:glycine betaine/proline transport system permease protein